MAPSADEAALVAATKVEMAAKRKSRGSNQRRPVCLVITPPVVTRSSRVGKQGAADLASPPNPETRNGSAHEIHETHEKAFCLWIGVLSVFAAKQPGARQGSFRFVFRGPTLVSLVVSHTTRCKVCPRSQLPFRFVWFVYFVGPRQAAFGGHPGLCEIIHKLALPALPAGTSLRQLRPASSAAGAGTALQSPEPQLVGP